MKDQELLIDLIEKLLDKDPLWRLGGGIKFSKYDINQLKLHPFFSKLKFNKMHLMNPLIQSCKYGYNFLEYKKQFENLKFTDKDKTLVQKIPISHMKTYDSTRIAFQDSSNQSSDVSSDSSSF